MEGGVHLLRSYLFPPSDGWLHFFLFLRDMRKFRTKTGEGSMMASLWNNPIQNTGGRSRTDNS